MKNKYSILISILALLLASPSILLVSKAEAATPGCYSASGSADRITITATDCPNADIQEDVNKGACYIRYNQSSTFTGQACSSITTGLNDNSGSSNITQSQEGGTDRDSFSGGQCEPEGDEGLNSENCGIINIVVSVINFLSAIAGIALVASLMISGYLYMTARDNAGQIEKAKARIIQTLIALTVFIFMYALLNFLIPGGLGLS
jgi:hypothetical protein